LADGERDKHDHADSGDRVEHHESHRIRKRSLMNHIARSTAIPGAGIAICRQTNCFFED
jgi:hypothetical protein